MEVRQHPLQDGFIITFPDGTEYATQEGDHYYPEAYEVMTGEVYVPPVIEAQESEVEAPDEPV